MKLRKMTKEEKLKFQHELYRLYITEDKCIKEICQIYNCHKYTIINSLKSFNIPTKNPKKYKCPIEGDRFNRWTFIREIREKWKKTRWLCKCECGVVKDLDYITVRDGVSQSCGCYHADKMRDVKWTGYEEMSGSYLWTIRNQAKTRNHEFTVTNEYLWDIFILQCGKCALTGENLYFSKNVHKEKQNASLDRIDSSKGYIEGNVRWVTKEINYARRQMTDEQFFNLCKKVFEYNKDKYDSNIMYKQRSAGSTGLASTKPRQKC